MYGYSEAISIEQWLQCYGKKRVHDNAFVHVVDGPLRYPSVDLLPAENPMVLRDILRELRKQSHVRPQNGDIVLLRQDLEQRRCTSSYLFFWESGIHLFPHDSHSLGRSFPYSWDYYRGPMRTIVFPVNDDVLQELHSNISFFVVHYRFNSMSISDDVGIYPSVLCGTSFIHYGRRIYLLDMEHMMRNTPSFEGNMKEQFRENWLFPAESRGGVLLLSYININRGYRIFLEDGIEVPLLILVPFGRNKM